jgi:type IV pilus assembly protein PilV
MKRRQRQSLSTMPRRQRKSLPRRQRGVILLEALLATLILAIGLLGAIGLQARAYSALSDADMRGEATIATERVLGTMGNDQLHLADYALAANAAPSARLAAWHAATLAALPGATIVITLTPTLDLSRTEVVVTISWTRKAGAALNTHRVIAYVALS